MRVASSLGISQESLESRLRDSLRVCERREGPSREGRGGGGRAREIGRQGRAEGRVYRNEMRDENGEGEGGGGEPAFIKIREQHIAFIAAGERRETKETVGRERAGTEVNRIVPIHPSGSSLDLDAPISFLHCLAPRITPSPLRHFSVYPLRILKKRSFTLSPRRSLFLFFFRSVHPGPPSLFYYSLVIGKNALARAKERSIYRCEIIYQVSCNCRTYVYILVRSCERDVETLCGRGGQLVVADNPGAPVERSKDDGARDRSCLHCDRTLTLSA